MIWYPLLKYICVDDKHADKVRRFLMILCVVFFLGRDAVVIFNFSFKINFITVFSNSILYVLMGYECSRFAKSEFFIKHKSKIGIVSGLMYCLGVGLCILFTYLCYISKGSFKDYFFHTSCIPVILSAASLVVAFLCINIKNEKFAKPIRYLGKQTLYVYLLQSPIHSLIAWLNLALLMYNTLGFGTYILIALIDMLAAFSIAIIANLIQGVIKNKTRNRKIISAL